MKSTLCAQLCDLALLSLPDPELTAPYLTYDLLDFAAGRNTVCTSSKFCRARSESRLFRLTSLPMPPPTTFRRSESASILRSIGANDDGFTASVVRNQLSISAQRRELDLPLSSPLPPPRPFRRVGSSRYLQNAGAEDASQATFIMSVEQRFDDDLFIFLFSSALEPAQ